MSACAYDRSMHYRRQIQVDRPPAEVFAYLADFENAADWDPGIASARRLTEGPTTVGSRFEVLAPFRGKTQRFEYVVTELGPGQRIVLHGEGDKALSDDSITVSGEGGRAQVEYDADIRLKGVYRVAEPFLRRTFTRMGDDALRGLQSRLNGAG
jgi:carbon monoxide dehydrogenase subunit G